MNGGSKDRLTDYTKTYRVGTCIEEKEKFNMDIYYYSASWTQGRRKIQMSGRK